MGGAVAEIAKGVQAMADLKIPIYKDGKIVGYESMGADAVTKVTSNIRSLVVAITGVMGEIGNNPDAQNDWGWFGSSKIEDGVEIVTSFADPIKKIADAAKTFMETNVDPVALNAKIQGVISGMTGALSSAGENAEQQESFVIVLGNVADKMKMIAENIDPWVKFVDNFKKYVDDMGRLKDTLNAFDKVNLKFTSDMFQGLAYLSGYKGAGSINQMSSALNDSIKQLTSMIEEFKKSVATPPPPPTTSTVPNTAPVKGATGPGAAAPAGKPNPADSKPGITIRQLEDMLSRVILKTEEA
jgi:methyl-accepting chemotaxis protein